MFLLEPAEGYLWWRIFLRFPMKIFSFKWPSIILSSFPSFKSEKQSSDFLEVIVVFSFGMLTLKQDLSGGFCIWTSNVQFLKIQDWRSHCQALFWKSGLILWLWLKKNHVLSTGKVRVQTIHSVSISFCSRNPDLFEEKPGKLTQTEKTKLLLCEPQ